jgi:cutinase
MFVIARGASEENSPINGKFGAFLGDPLMDNVTALLSGARGYPVQYPASSNLDKDTITGREDIINRLRKQTAACPNQKFALVGYSGGAMVVHAAAEAMPPELTLKILAILLYGSPTMACAEDYGKIPDTLLGRLQESCSKGDNTCDKTGQCHARHMDYVKKPWIDRGANFIVAAFKGTPMPADIGRALMLESADVAIQNCNHM